MKSLLNVRLAEARMTKRDVERLTGISHTTLWKYSRDDLMGRATLDNLASIAEVLGCKAKDLYEE